MIDDFDQMVADAIEHRADKEHQDWAVELREVFKQLLEKTYDAREEPIGKETGKRLGVLAKEYVDWCAAFGVVAIPSDEYTLPMYLHLKRKEGLEYHQLVEIAQAVSRAHYATGYSDRGAFQLTYNVIANIKRETE